VDADLRRPTVAKRFGIGKTTGLSDLLLGGDDLRDHVVRVGVPNLLLLPAGTIPPNPSELLASPAMRALEAQILRRVDLVIYDSPAVLAVPDALELGRHVDVAILVGRAGVTGRRQMQAALERLVQVGTDVAGTVLNDITRMEGYYYSYYYEDQPDPSGRRSSRLPFRSGRKTRQQAPSEEASEAGIFDEEEATEAHTAETGEGTSAADLSGPWTGEAYEPAEGDVEDLEDDRLFGRY
jgi:capsular exopolysaccharide synthesis family protein